MDLHRHASHAIRYCRVTKYENPKHREKEEALRKVFTEQVKTEENRFRHWEQQVRAHVMQQCITQIESMSHD